MVRGHPLAPCPDTPGHESLPIRLVAAPRGPLVRFPVVAAPDERARVPAPLLEGAR